MEVTKLQYDQALAILAKVELAQKAKEAYEEQQGWIEEPIQKIIQNGKPVIIEGEPIRESTLLWRATKVNYVHEKGTVQRTVVYSSDPNGKELLKSISDTSKIL